MRKFLSTLSLTAALASLPCVLFAGPDAVPTEVASASPAGAPKTLPAFSLPDPEGKMHDSKEWKGKVVILDFWATWCVSCRETIPVLQRFQAAYGDKGLLVAGVSTDKGPKEKVAKFARKMKMDYQILWDGEDAMAKLFGFEGLPSVFVFGRDGSLLKAMPQYTSGQEKELAALIAGQFNAAQSKP